MNYVERGLYRHLLDECWVEGGFASSFREICEMLDCPMDVLQDAWTKLAPCFYLDGDFYRNEEMEELRTTKDKERVLKSVSGKIGGKARAHIDNGSQASAKQVLSSCHIEEKSKEEKSKSKEENRREEAYASQNSSEFSLPPCPYEEIKNLWHEKLPTLQAIGKLTPKRQSALKKLWADVFEEESLTSKQAGLDWFCTYFDHIKLSKFLMGKTEKPFNCTIDFVSNYDNAINICEGKYHDKVTQVPTWQPPTDRLNGY